jgi:hypothetical protein
VDWDYFFPNLHHFDWGFSERIPLYFNGLWEIRAYQDLYSSSNGYFKSKRTTVMEYVQPRIEEVKSFWKTVCPVPPLGLVVAESHESLYEMASYWPSGSIWNFDAHHDFGYESDSEKNCGNWAKRLYDEGYFDGVDREYRLIYPEWRKKDPEANMPGTLPEDVIHNYGMPKKMPYFRYVFICRSSVWTPSWCDKYWMEFIEYWKEHSLWTTKSHAPYAIKPREFNEESAEACRKQFEEIMSKTNYLEGSHG